MIASTACDTIKIRFISLNHFLDFRFLLGDFFKSINCLSV